MNMPMQDFGVGPGGMMGGPMISGKWFNKKTGITVNVRDALIDGDSMIVMTDRGQIPMDEFSQYYIQASDEIYDEHGNVIDNIKNKSTKHVQKEKKEVKTSQQQIQVFRDKPNIEENPKPYVDDDAYIYGDGDIIEDNEEIKSKVEVEETNKNFELIKKIFDKRGSKPKLNIRIDWADFPNKELSMLVDFFDVSKEEIAEYIGKYLINSDLLNESLIKWLNENLACEK